MRGRARNFGDMSFKVLFLCLFMAVGQVAVGAAAAGDEQWIKLSDLPVGSGVETETIRVGRDTGPIERIKVATTAADILVQELRIYYADGDMQRVMRHERVASHSAPSTAVLEGQGKPVDYIEITFKGGGFGRRGARLELWVQQSSLHADGARNVERNEGDASTMLGQQDVGRGVDHAVITVGRRAGHFAAIQLVVSKSDVAFHEVRVVYVDGETDVLAVRRLIRAGDRSPLLQLKGEARIIREIELVHEANPSTSEDANVQVLGWRTPDEARVSSAADLGPAARRGR